MQHPRISSKCFLKVNLESKLIPRNFTLSLSPYSFRMGSEFLAREGLENMMTLVFQDLVLFSIWHITLSVFVGPCAKVLLYFYIEQCHQQTGISSFVCGEVLVSH